MAESFESLEVWELAMKLAEQVYKITKSFPEEEKFGITSQLRRSAISVSSNIAEGAGRESKKDFIRYLRIARGSLNEVESQLILASRLEYIEQKEFKKFRKLIDKIGRKLRSFRNYLKQK